MSAVGGLMLVVGAEVVRGVIAPSSISFWRSLVSGVGGLTDDGYGCE